MEKHRMDKRLLQLAGNLADSARRLVGGHDLNGWPINPANIYNVAQLAEELRRALDNYDQEVINLLESRISAEDGTNS